MVSRTHRFLTFMLDNHLCAIPAHSVREINHISQLSSEAADPLPTKINVRDAVFPLINFRVTLGLDLKASSPESRVIIVEGKDGFLGISVDSVVKVIDLPSIIMPHETDDHAPVFESIQIQDYTLILVDIYRVMDSKRKGIAEAFRHITGERLLIAS